MASKASNQPVNVAQRDAGEESPPQGALILEYASGRASYYWSVLSWLGPLVMMLGMFCMAIAMAMLMNVLAFHDPRSWRPLYIATICAMTLICIATMMWRELLRQSRPAGKQADNANPPSPAPPEQSLRQGEPYPGPMHQTSQQQRTAYSETPPQQSPPPAEVYREEHHAA